MRQRHLIRNLLIINTALFVTAILLLTVMFSELRGMRQEQVKNKFYSLPPEAITKINSDPKADMIRRSFETKIEVEGDVKISEPVEVKIKDQPVEVEIKQQPIAVEVR